MPIPLREDVAYIILKKINESGQRMHEVGFDAEDFIGRSLTQAELLGHLDYLNQMQFIKAEFTGNAYANQEDVPDAVDAKEFDLRIANSFGAPDGPLSHLITFKAAELTEKGRKILERMEANPPEALNEGPSVAIAVSIAGSNGWEDGCLVAASLFISVAGGSFVSNDESVVAKSCSIS